MKILFFFYLLVSQTLAIGTAFLKVPIMTKSLSLAGSGIAFVNNPSLFRLNPALLYTDQNKTNAFFSYNSWLFNTKGHSLIIVQPYKNKFTFGFALRSLNLNKLEFRNDIPSLEPLSYFSNNGTSFEFVFSTRKNKYQFGSSIKYISMESYIYKSYGIATDLGLVYILNDDNLSFGASIINFGLMNEFQSNVPKLPIKGSMGFMFKPKVKNKNITITNLASLGLYNSGNIVYSIGNQFSIKNFHLISGLNFEKENFSISGGFEIEKSSLSISYGFNFSNHNLGTPHIFQIKLIIP